MNSKDIKSPFNVSSIQHRIFGSQVRLQLAENFVLNFTQAEASSLSFALIAVRDGVSPEHEIYMSPISSDYAFTCEVKNSGISIAVGADVVELDWSNVGKLAQALGAAVD
jgi:hypothetical protein